MQNAVLVVAAGRGTRLGGDAPKQYQTINGTPMLTHTMRAVLACDQVDALKVVIHEDDLEAYEHCAGMIEDGRLLPPVFGGDTRAQSVRNGLNALSPDAPHNVLVHDAARPFIKSQTITALIEALSECEGAFPAVPVADALWSVRDGLSAVDRTGLMRAQTPQAFRYEVIRKAHTSATGNELDDVEVAQKAGANLIHVEGDERNFKVTTKDDLNRAEDMMTDFPDIRVGQGFDVHAFEAGDEVILNGVSIPHERKLKGHSDADVAMHAITDAIYGALAEGDIGQWFPPSDPQWKGAKSDIFLKHAMERVSEREFAVSHLDCTIICEQPKIGPHATKMREELSRITGLQMDRISVKATTSEKLGFTGRGEGIAAQATATLVKA